MRFYIASSLKNIDFVRELASLLKKEGFEFTYDWTEVEGVKSIELISAIGENEKEAVKKSDFVVLLLPGGKSSHVELGIGLGLDKRVYVYSSTEESYNMVQTSTFYYVKGVDRYVGSIEGFAEYLLKKETEFM